MRAPLRAAVAGHLDTGDIGTAVPRADGHDVIAGVLKALLHKVADQHFVVSKQYARLRYLMVHAAPLGPHCVAYVRTMSGEGFPCVPNNYSKPEGRGRLCRSRRLSLADLVIDPRPQPRPRPTGSE